MTDERRGELRKFMRAMRARLNPKDVGLPRMQRQRRTAGLRIEEAAALAGVSLTWYSAFERGNDIRVSDDVLARIAASLRLTLEEKRFLRDLTRSVDHLDDAEPALEKETERQTVDAFTGGAAFMADAFWTVSTYNALADDLYGFSKAGETNLLVRMFDDPMLRSLHVEWDRIATQMTDILHGTYSDATDDVHVNALIERLRRYHDFVERWEAYGMRAFVATRARLIHPRFGDITLNYVSYVQSPPRRPRERRILVVQTPADAVSERRLSEPHRTRRSR